MKLVVRKLGVVSYSSTLEQMRHFASIRDETSADEIWCLEHPPVFTQGQAGRASHLLNIRDIPLVQSDRGGQVTYHGPGQLVVYILMDIRRACIGPRELVKRIEDAIISLLANEGVRAQRRAGAPGVYVDEAKIAALGLRIRRGTSYHGLSLNVNLDLEPFSRINPCGYKGLEVTRLKDLGVDIDCDRSASHLVPILMSSLYGDAMPIDVEYSSEPRLVVDSTKRNTANVG
ncbi:MAG: lipoyl(octanoyl) transferase [Gammaproteobacteria bacterium]|jgi:lipoyl(octanoyl) transferase